MNLLPIFKACGVKLCAFLLLQNRCALGALNKSISKCYLLSVLGEKRRQDMIIINIENIEEIDRLNEQVDVYDEIIEVTNEDLGEDRIIITGPLYRLKGTSIIFAEGDYCAYDEETDDVVPDFSVSLLYDEKDGLDLNNPVYWEQDPIGTMFHNYNYIQQVRGKIQKDKSENHVA